MVLGRFAAQFGVLWQGQPADWPTGGGGPVSLAPAELSGGLQPEIPGSPCSRLAPEVCVGKVPAIHQASQFLHKYLTNKQAPEGWEGKPFHGRWLVQIAGRLGKKGKAGVVWRRRDEGRVCVVLKLSCQRRSLVEDGETRAAAASSRRPPASGFALVPLSTVLSCSGVLGGDLHCGCRSVFLVCTLGNMLCTPARSWPPGSPALLPKSSAICYIVELKTARLLPLFPESLLGKTSLSRLSHGCR